MQTSGRERRKKGLINRARRLLYGLLLLAASPGATAADELAYAGQYRADPVAATAQQALLATLQGLLLIHAESPESSESPIQGNGYPRIALDTVTARLLEQAVSDPVLLRVAVSDSESIRDGVGINLAIADIGNFHLNLYARRNAKTEGKRWHMNSADANPAKAETRTWSLGGSLEMVRTGDGSRHLALVPELLVALGDQPRYVPFEASVKFANWRSASERQALDEKVAQVTFKWRL